MNIIKKLFKSLVKENTQISCKEVIPSSKEAEDSLQNIKKSEKEFTLFIETKQEQLEKVYQEELAKINREKQETEDRIKRLLTED